jgi:hypothetical protein
MGYQALLGSVYHAASEDPDEALARTDEPGYWHNLINLVREPGTRYTEKIDGVTRVITNARVQEIALAMASYNTPSLGLIIHRANTYLERRFKILTRERKMVHTVHGLSFAGTMDMEVMDLQTGEFGIADYKSSGIWDKVLYGKAIKTQDWAEKEVTFHPQLRHYDWLLRKVEPTANPAFYMVVTPANLWPMEKASKNKVAGDQRGQLYFKAPARSDLILDYERQLLGWLKLMAQRVYLKSLPQVYGALDCPGCPFFSRCQGEAQEQSEETGDLLRSIYG